MGTVWRLIIDGDHDAATNMAIDEAIMTAHAGGTCPPTIRLYGWDRPSISLGYLQDINRGGLDLDYCKAHNVALVRRLTGGRAVLHGHDLTFSIVFGQTELPAEHRSVIGSHTWLMGGIVAGLRQLGVDAGLGSLGRPSAVMSADCFAHAAACDVVAGGRKVAGSAQVRRQGMVLEQGSIPYLRPEIEPSALFRRQINEDGELCEGLDRDRIQQAIIDGFRDALQIKLVEGVLSQAETDSARNLAETRFRKEEWTLRRPGALVDIRK